MARRTNVTLASEARSPIGRFELHHVDSLLGVPRYVKRGLPTLLATDPPYNIGHPYLDYDDRKVQEEFIEYVGARIGKSVEHLHPHASVWIAINTTNVSELDIYCKRTLGLFPRGQICWHYTFGQNGKKNFTPSHITWLYYTRHRTKFTFNPDAIKVPSARQLVYNDKRQAAGGRLPNDVWVLLPDREPAAFKPLDDTWLFSRVCGTFKAKIAESPNQMPVEMMRRIILACSDPGDTVLDSFNGTGTTGKAAITSNRNYIGFDVSAACIRASEQSLRAASVVPATPMARPRTRKG